MQFDDQRVEVANAMNPQQLMCTVFHHFENFRDDLLPVHSEYNQAGQLCFWELSYGGDFPKEMYPQVDGEAILTRATIRHIAWQPVETYPLRKGMAIPNQRYVWARIEDGEVADWRDFEATPDKDKAREMRQKMIDVLGKDNARVKSGLIKGRTLHIVKPPSHLRKTSSTEGNASNSSN